MSYVIHFSRANYSILNLISPTVFPKKKLTHKVSISQPNVINV